MRPRLLMPAFLCCLVAVAGRAESPADEHYFVDTWLDPPKAAVGEHVTLNVMIGVDSYFSGATELGLPDIAHALVLHDQGAINGDKYVGATYFTTQTHQVDVYPGREGIMVVPAVQVRFTQAVEVDGELTNQVVQFSTGELLGLVTVPPAMRGIPGFMVSADVQVADDWQGVKTGEYQVGDVLTRVVTVAATGMSSLNMPQFTPRAPRGVSVTLAEPGLSSSSGREATAATMVQQISYAIESPGQYRLGGEVLSWWDPVNMARQDHAFALVPVDAGGLPWRLLAIAAMALVIAVLSALALWDYLRRRDPVDLAIRQRLHSSDAGERLAALYACADYHHAPGEEPVRLRRLLSASSALVNKVLAARFSASAERGEPSPRDSKALYRAIRDARPS